MKNYLLLILILELAIQIKNLDVVKIVHLLVEVAEIFSHDLLSGLNELYLNIHRIGNDL
jgi:hypothetical protein